MKSKSSPKVGESVYFNNIGFRHLIWTRGKHRTKREQMRRFALLSHIPKIISNPNATFVHKVKTYGTRRASFWIFKKEIKGSTVTVVVRRIGNGRTHFFSVY